LSSGTLHERIRAQVDALPLIDTHEHLQPESDRVRDGADFSLLFIHYAGPDLMSAGMSQRDHQLLCDRSRPLAERWRAFKPFWRAIHNTSYAKAVRIGIRDIYGIEDITDRTYRELSERMQAASRKGLYRRVLREKGGIAKAILCGPPLEDADLFVDSLYIDGQVNIRSRDEVMRECRAIGASGCRLEDLVRRLEHHIAFAAEGGMVATKLGLAYLRTLWIDRPSRSAAEDVLARCRRSDGQLSHAEAKPLCDYLIHEAARACGEVGLPMQIHTGIQEGNGNWIANSDPKGLVRLFMDHPRTRFDLFHGGYPFTSSFAVLAKNFPNAHANMCWLHCISQSVGRQLLEELIDTVPMSKIFAFGGDYIFVEGAYGHSVMARENVTRVLCKKIEEGYFTEEQALVCARWVMHDAPARFFGIDSTSTGEEKARRKRAAGAAG